MDVERLRQVLRDLPTQVDEAAAQLKAVAAQVEKQIDALAPLLDNLNNPWDFSEPGPVKREEPTLEVKLERLAQVNTIWNGVQNDPVQREWFLENGADVINEAYGNLGSW